MCAVGVFVMVLPLGSCSRYRYCAHRLVGCLKAYCEDTTSVKKVGELGLKGEDGSPLARGGPYVEMKHLSAGDHRYMPQVASRPFWPSATYRVGQDITANPRPVPRSYGRGDASRPDPLRPTRSCFRKTRCGCRRDRGNRRSWSCGDQWSVGWEHLAPAGYDRPP